MRLNLNVGGWSRRLRTGTAMVGLGVGALAGFAQETISDEVWLGSTLFTIEDLENLTDAAKLTQDQQDAALELMRGGMAQARTMALKSYRSMDEIDWGTEDYEKQLEEWQERQKKQVEEIEAVEKSVMNDLKSLLDDKQEDEGWAKFERSRRRLLLRATAALQQMTGDRGAMAMYGQGMPDLIATVRASKLTPTEVEAIAMPMDQYATAIDALIGEMRTHAKSALTGQQNAGWGGSTEEIDVEKITDILKRLHEAHIRGARRIEEALTGEAKERFMRQRLRAEMMWQWVSPRRMPQMKAVLKITTLSEPQKKRIGEIMKEHEEKLLAMGVEGLRERDDKLLKGETPANPWEQQDESAMARTKKDRQIRKDMVKAVLEELDDAQRTAYETGIQSDKELVDAFEKRRHAQHAWGLDQDLMDWDWAGSGEDEEER